MEIKKDVLSKATLRGYELLNNKGFVISAMSIGNSYFSNEKIDELLPFLNKHFSQTKILIAKKISVHTYKALGYDEKKARQKTKLAGNRLKNSCIRTMQKIRTQGQQVNVDFVDWENEVEHDAEYEKQLEIIKELYNRHKRLKDVKKSFYKDARDTTKNVLMAKLEDKKEIDRAIDEGVEYLLEELAFILAAPKIFNVTNVAYIYHREWPIFTKLIDGKYDKKIRKNVAFIQLEEPVEVENPNV